MPIVIDPNQGDPTQSYTATSIDGRLKATLDPANNGVLLAASSFPVPPERVLFLRDGQRVRSGDTAVVVGGAALAYDHEAPIGPASWTATPFYRWTDGTLYPTAETEPAVLYLPDLELERDWYVKSIANPSLSLRLTASGEEPALIYTGRTNLSDVLGSDVLAGSYDVHTLGVRTITFQVRDSIERDALIVLLNAGPVLVQSLAMYDIPDFYALAQDITEQFMLGGYDSRRLVQVAFQPVLRPATAGAPLAVPGRTYGELAANYYSYGDLLSRPTYADLLR